MNENAGSYIRSLESKIIKLQDEVIKQGEQLSLLRKMNIRMIDKFREVRRITSEWLKENIE